MCKKITANPTTNPNNPITAGAKAFPNKNGIVTHIHPIAFIGAAILPASIIITVTRYKEWPKNPSAKTENTQQGGTLSKYIVQNAIGKNLASGYMLEAAGPDSKEADNDQRVSVGTYKIIKNPGTKGDFRLAVLNHSEAKKLFGDRSFINIHPGNFPTDIEGCFAPGVTAADNSKDFPYVYNSTKAYNKLRDIIKNSPQEVVKTYDGKKEYNTVMYDVDFVAK